MARNKPARRKPAQRKTTSKPKADAKPKSKPKSDDAELERMRAFWEAFSPEQRSAVLVDTKLHDIVTSAYSSIAANLKAIGIKASDPIIITSEGELIDPDDYFSDEADAEDEEGEEYEEVEDDILPDDIPLDGAKLIKKLKKWYKQTETWTQTDIAGALGVSPSTINSWLDGRVKSPRDEYLWELNALLALDPASDPEEVLSITDEDED